MSTNDHRFDDGVPGEGDAPYEWIDEWLCEYVDGTMDPSLEAVFEKYVEANPELKEHVERLRETRELLCNCGLSDEPSSEVEADIRDEVEEDLIEAEASLSEVAHKRPVAVLGFVSSMAVALVIGFLAGTMFVEAPPSRTVTADQVEERRAVDKLPTPPPSQLEGRLASPDDPTFVRQSSVPLSTVDSLRRSSQFTTIGSP